MDDKKIPFMAKLQMAAMSASTSKTVNPVILIPIRTRAVITRMVLNKEM